MNFSASARIILVAAVLLPACTSKRPMQSPDSPLSAKITRFVPTTITADTSRLSAGDRAALSTLVQAARLMDSIYLRQVWVGNMELFHQLSADTSAGGRQLFRYFLINMGPWVKIDHDSAFITGVPPRPPQATYYPDDMTTEEFSRWTAALPPAGKQKALGFFWVIRRDSARNLGQLEWDASSGVYRPKSSS